MLTKVIKTTNKTHIFIPVSVPGVGTKPVLDAILYAPAENANRMATQCFPRVSLVDARLVLHKVGVHGEISFNWA